jgi:septum formation protein
LFPAGEQFVLASASPQRRKLLDSLGVDFAVRVSGFVERETGVAAEVAVANALGKARAAAGAGEVVLGVDTVVSLGGRLYGKPADENQARQSLLALSGAAHTVVSGVALIGLDEAPRIATCSTEVRFRALDAETIEWYLSTGEWRGRAGGYAIQGAGCALVESIVGDWTNVVGLPVATLLELHPGLLLPRKNRLNPENRADLQE